MCPQHWLEIDRQNTWHPYTGVPSAIANIPVTGAKGMELYLEDGSTLLDGMSSWWAVIHGYNHAVLNRAITQQLEQMSHVMFGGITHPTAISLVDQLVSITPDPLKTVFLADSGSVAVEVALKIAIQYWHACGQTSKQRFIALKHGYHGDTSGAMSVSDPENGMHHIFAQSLLKQFHAEAPQSKPDDDFNSSDLDSIRFLLEKHNHEVAAVIVEPIVQGAGGMRFYHPQYLVQLRELCDHYQVLLIADEIATNFGRTGELFACNHADICPDIMCLGKALSGGYMTLAATIATKNVSSTISNANPGVFMHGPTFMANPLACAVSSASIELLLNTPWQENINRIEKNLRTGLKNCIDLPGVKDVRVLGAIGVVEMEKPVDIGKINQSYINKGVWLRPFNKLIYTMPPFIASEDNIFKITDAMTEAVITSTS